MREAVHREGRNTYLYDADLIDSRQVFTLFVEASPANVQQTAGGRGQIHVVCHAGQDYVLRHYRRGGLFARITADRYVWTGLRFSRPWREWRLLAQLHAHGLPVPRPLAAKLTRRAAIYRADLATLRLPAEGSLAEHLLRAPLSETAWRKLGEVIWMFHALGVCHADLNAHNVLLADAGAQFWLIDFDKATLRAPAQSWQSENVQRLKRSLDKLQGANPRAHFEQHGWHCLFGAYSKASNTPVSAHSC